jgi:hypothetical protein
MELSNVEIQTILKRLPHFEASYETILHKNHPSNENYNVGLAIPFGKKYYLWFSFFQDRNVCFLMELNREKKIVKISIKEYGKIPVGLALGTLLYVSCLEERETTHNNKYFLEDIYYYKGQPVYKSLYSAKLGVMDDFFQNCPPTLSIYLPEMWWNGEEPPAIHYPVHHIQYRCLNHYSPYLNKSKEVNVVKPMPPTIPNPINIIENTFKPDYRKPQYRLPTVFIVSANIKFDIYNLHAFGRNNSNEYYGVASIPTFNTSVFMNHLFRNIRENINLDYIEESDDEEDFENIKEDKYVDLKKRLLMECVFNPKFKKWIPIKVVDNHRRVIHINKL